MRLALRTPAAPTPARARRRTPREHEPSRRPQRPEDRARRAGGPEDLALYACECGFAFKAAVTASVSCPHCGGDQAW